MITNKEYFRESLYHRLQQCVHLAENPETLNYIPEIFLRTLKDFYRLQFGKEGLGNAAQLCKELNLELPHPEILADWEASLRSEKKHQNLKVSKDQALALCNACTHMRVSMRTSY